MKNVYRYFALLVLIIMVLPGCNKDDDAPSRDYTELFKNTVWTGEYKDSAARIKPYSMEFVIGNAFIFHDYSGDFIGSYALQNNKITCSIPGMSAKFSAIVTDENTFTEIQHTGSQSWTMLSGDFNVLADQLLDNTYWAGKLSDGSNLELSFKPGNQVTPLSDLRPQAVTYTRRAGTIRCAFSYSGNTFSVLQTNNTIKGVWSAQYTFSVTKKQN